MSDIQKISLAENLVTAVCTGAHRNTFRIGDKYADLRPGPAVFVSAETGTVIPVTITKITQKPFGQIRRKDVKDQDTTVKNLKDALKYEHYKNLKITDSTIVHIVSFEPPAVAQDIRAVRNKLKQEVGKLGLGHILDRADLHFFPDYSLDEGSGEVSRGGNEEIILAVDSGNASDLVRYGNVLRQAVSMDSLEFAGDNDYRFMKITGNVAGLRQRLEEAYPEEKPVRRGVISRPRRPSP